MQDHEPGGQEPSEEELERRLQALLGGSHTSPLSSSKSEVPTTSEDELDARLNEISEKLDAAKARRMPDVPEWNYKRPDRTESKLIDKHSYRGIGFGLTLAYALIGPILVGYGIGRFLDAKNPPSNTAQTWGTVIGILLGFVGFLVILNRSDDRESGKK